MARSYRHPSIAREGWGIIGVLLLLAGLFGWFLDLWEALPPLALAAVALFYFRDPIRRIPPRPLGVVSPIDGRVRSVNEGKDPFLQREQVRRIRMRQSLTGVHSLRSPIEGKVMERWFHRQRGRGGRIETVAYWIRTDEDDDVVWTVSLASHKLLRMELQPGERVGQGQRCGFAFFPAVSTLYLPWASRVTVQPGDRLRAGEDVLAEFVHRRADLDTVLEGQHAIP